MGLQSQTFDKSRQIHMADIQYQPKMKEKQFSRKQPMLGTNGTKQKRDKMLTLGDHVTILVQRQKNIWDDNLVWAKPRQKRDGVK